MITFWNLLYVHFTRAAERLYILMEDLRDGIQFPRGGKLRETGLNLGLGEKAQELDKHNDAETRRLLFLANLCNVSHRVCKTQLGVMMV